MADIKVYSTTMCIKVLKHDKITLSLYNGGIHGHNFILQWQHLPTNIACPIFFLILVSYK